MKTYEVTHMVEVFFRHSIRAESVEQANEIAIDSTTRQMRRIDNLAKGIRCANDIQDDYMPATDDETPVPSGQTEAFL